MMRTNNGKRQDTVAGLPVCLISYRDIKTNEHAGIQSRTDDVFFKPVSYSLVGTLSVSA